MERGTPQPRSVRFVLEREDREAGRAPRMPVELPDDPRVRNVVVRPHSLESYGELLDREDEDEDEREGGEEEGSDGNK